MSTVARAFFTITGEGLTHLARNGMLSDRPGWAFRLLAEGLVGEGSTEAAIKVLDGKAKIVGDSTEGFDVVPDQPSEYLKDLRYVYAGRIRIRGRWWRPRAIITSYGPKDARYASEAIGSTPTRFSRGFNRWCKKRVEFFVGESCPDELLDVEHDGRSVVFEPCSELPQWWKEPLSPDAAVADFLAAGRFFLNVGHEQDEIHPRTSRVRSKEDLEAERVRQQAEDAAFAKKLAWIGHEVRAQAGDDVFVLECSDGRTLKVPRAPFMRWALHRTTLAHLAPPWKLVAESGIKMNCDDPYHTDWLLGAGCAIKDGYEGPVKEASYREMFDLQYKLGNFECAVVIDAGECAGTIGRDIVVLPDLSPEHLDAVSKARAIITERGGQLAHLATVARERSITIMRVEDACTRFRKGMSVTLVPAEGRVRISMHKES